MKMGSRKDGRSYEDLRPLSSRFGLLFRADGSAEFLQGESHVIAGIFGPGDVKKREEDPETVAIDVSFTFPKGHEAPLEAEYGRTIRGIFEAVILGQDFPRCGISICVQVVRDDGSVLSAAINAVCLALLHSGIPMKSLVAAATVASTGTHLLLDPTTAEEKEATSVQTMAFFDSYSNVKNGKLAGSLCSGKILETVYFTSFDACCKACGTVTTFMRKAYQIRRNATLDSSSSTSNSSKQREKIKPNKKKLKVPTKKM
eukprot:GCRY01002200.1.p1 GENE.GCRY01002200.1~~GCRY01002200.1.p1  ORF type:complete len:258 (+),score=1.89 GCRY01002200.1:128-901(+)